MNNNNNYENTPPELQESIQWLNWIAVPKDNGKIGKVSCNPITCDYISPTDTTNFITFKQAIANLKTNPKLSGIIFSITDRDIYVFIDLDACIDDKGQVSPFAQTVVKYFKSYTEVSYSGKGLHIFIKIKDKLPEHGTKKIIDGNEVELYSKSHTSAFTGNVYGDYTTIEYRDKELLVFLKKFGFIVEPKPVSKVSSITLDEQRILDIMLRVDYINRLYNGNMSDYNNNHSIADYHLCKAICFYTDSTNVVYNIFMSSSLNRDGTSKYKGKYDTYVMKTIDKAMQDQTKKYTGVSGNGGSIGIHNETKTTHPTTGGINNVKETNNMQERDYQPSNELIAEMELQQEEYIKEEIKNGKAIKVDGKICEIVNQNDKDIKEKLASGKYKLTKHGTLEEVGILGYTAREIQLKDIPEMKWFIPTILPEGLTIVYGDPKAAKSCLILQLCLALVSGSKHTLGKIDLEGDNTNVLYVSMQDPENVIQDRIDNMLYGKYAPDNLYVRYDFPKIGKGCIGEMEKVIAADSKIKVIIFDMLTDILSDTQSINSIYKHDYKSIQPLKLFANKHNLSIVCIHHSNKQPTKDASVISRLSGSHGLSGGCDTIIEVRKEFTKDEYQKGEFRITGKMAGARYKTKWCHATQLWEIEGDIPFHSKGEMKLLVGGIFINDPNRIWKIKDVMDTINASLPENIGKKSYTSISNTIKRLVDDGSLDNPAYGKYQYAKPVK